MFGIVDLWTFVIAAVLIILLPGPNSLYVLSAASRLGRRAGFRAAAGVFCGDTVLLVASAAGLASIFAASPTLYNILRWLGVAYLAWLASTLIYGGWKTWRQRAEAPVAQADRPMSVGVATKTERPYFRALIASLLNPKAILFIVAFLVQFVDPAYAWPMLSYAILGLILQACSVAYLSALIFAGDRFARAFRARRHLAAAGTGAVGTVMIAFAAKLATSG